MSEKQLTGAGIREETQRKEDESSLGEKAGERKDGCEMVSLNTTIEGKRKSNVGDEISSWEFN